MPPDSPKSPDLSTIQQWFQSVITHPDGIPDAIESAEAQKLIPLSRNELELVIRRSKNLSAEQRIGIYASAFYARLMECLRDSFPVLTRALGRELFDDFAMEYLQQFPSRTYTLNHLADHFVEFLQKSDAPMFLIDLARLEWSIEQVFDGPGIEQAITLQSADLQGIADADSLNLNLICAPCLRLLRFSFPVNAYYSAAKQAAADAELPIAQPADEYVALTRRNFIVRRIPQSAAQFALLAAIQSGRRLADAIADAAAQMPDVSDDELAGQIRQWLAEWASAQFFMAIDTTS